MGECYVKGGPSWSVFGHLRAIQRNRNSLLMFENIANVPLLDITKKAFIEGEPW